MHADASLPPAFRACLVSVGGSPRAVSPHAARTAPAYVAYFCSAETRDKTESTSVTFVALVSDYTGQDTTTVDLAAPGFTTAWFA